MEKEHTVTSGDLGHHMMTYAVWCDCGLTAVSFSDKHARKILARKHTQKVAPVAGRE